MASASTPAYRLNDRAPEIYPVNHTVDRDTIVFPTDPGQQAVRPAPQPGGLLPGRRHRPADATGWSVLVKGRAA
jgi:hypothetical protein